MPFRKSLLSLLVFVHLFTYIAPPVQAAPEIVGQAAALIDSKSGEIVYTKNADTPLAPASTTKVLTGIIALEETKLTDIVTAGKDTGKVEPSAIGLKDGETITMENLLYSLLLKSANDAAIAIAEHISGSVPQFAALMNAKAREWGASRSNFANPNGLPDENHYATARDLAIIAKHAMENPEFRRIVDTKVKVIPRADDDDIKWLQNHNKLLWRYDGANGIKTGYTREAQQCLVASAERNGQEFVAVILGSKGGNVWNDATALLDYGFANFTTVKHKSAATPVQNINVKSGVRQAGLVTQKDFYYTLPKGGKGVVAEKIELKQDIEAPVKKGQVLGQLRFTMDGKDIGTVNLVALNEVAAEGLALSPPMDSPVPWLAGLAMLIIFIAWNLRRRRRRLKYKNKIWLNRRAIR